VGDDPARIVANLDVAVDEAGVDIGKDGLGWL
jgi:hypothetical protein